MRSPVALAGYHTAGAPLQVVVSGGPQLAGTNMRQRYDGAFAAADAIRRLIVNEPRGSAAAHGCLITPPDDDEADLGAVFFDRNGFLAACGHGTIALATWAIESGFVQPEAGMVVIDLPAGRVTARADIEDGKVRLVEYTAPGYVAARFMPVQLRDDVISVDIAYGGAYYAAVDARELGIAVDRANRAQFSQLGAEVAAVLFANPAIEHPTDHRLSGLAGTIFYELSPDGSGLYQRSVTVFADGVIDRSPCGTGTSARLALLDSNAELPRGETLLSESMIGGRFTGRVVGDTQVGGIHGVMTEISGQAFRTGTHTLLIDENDPLGTGFQLP